MTVSTRIRNRFFSENSMILLSMDDRGSGGAGQRAEGLGLRARAALRRGGTPTPLALRPPPFRLMMMSSLRELATQQFRLEREGDRDNHRLAGFESLPNLDRAVAHVSDRGSAPLELAGFFLNEDERLALLRLPGAGRRL